LSTPPLLMVRDAGAKFPMNVCPKTVTLEPAPVITALPATPKLVVVSVPPLATVSVPPSTMVEPPTVSEPPLIVSAGPEQLAQSLRSPPMVPILPPKLAPVSVSIAVSSSSSEPAPPNVPENVLLLLPTMSQQGGRSDGDRAAARQRPDLGKGPIADRQGRARVDGEAREE
jgi:hypothetical protein